MAADLRLKGSSGLPTSALFAFVGITFLIRWGGIEFCAGWLPNGHATAFYSIGAMRRRHPEWFREDLGALFALLSQGRIAPVVAEILPLEEVRRAHERDEAGAVAGKLVLRVTEP